MVEFSDNNNISSSTFMSFFYLTKGFHSRMSFDSETTIYESTQKRLQIIKASDIVVKMKELLKYETQQLKKSRKVMSHQTNKHRKNVEYEVNDWVWLFSRNIKSLRPCKDLKDKQLDFFQVIDHVETFYRLQL